MRAFIVRLTLAVLLTVSAFGATGAPWAAQQLQGVSDPRSMPNLAAWYDTSDASSYLTATGLKLLGDKSGNSGVNVLALNGVAGNSASIPDAANLDLGVAFGFEVDVSLVDWTPSASQDLFGRWDGTASKRSWLMRIVATTGIVQAQISTDGLSGGIVTWDSTVAPTVADFGRLQIRFLRNGTLGQFFTSTDGTTWTQLGTDVTGSSAAAPFATDLAMFMGCSLNTVNHITGNLYSMKVYSDAGTTVIVNIPFSAFSKLATSGTATTGQTVTINTTGDTGARICGARDVVQMTGTKQPSLPGVGALFDGSDDFMKAAAWAMAQPVTVYLALSQLSYTALDNILDGTTYQGMGLYQSGGTPNAVVAYAGAGAIVQPWALNASAVVTSVFNAASSLTRINRDAAVTGNVGTNNANGITIGARPDGNNPANILLLEVLVFNAAHTQAQQDAVIGYLARHWGIAGGFALAPIIPIFAPGEAPPISPWKREDELIAA